MNVCKQNYDACLLGINVRDRSRIMTDIYGSQNENWLHNVVEDEENVDDFKVSLDSLQPLWDNLCGNHWF